MYSLVVADEVGAYVLFISTDYVFDGTKPPYKTTDTPNPLNKYGLSKAEGEKLVLEASSGQSSPMCCCFFFSGMGVRKV